MSLESHIKSLNSKVNQIEAEIHKAYVHHLPTSDLKKVKLHILDEIQNLVKQHAA